jgi:murein DD-endopeptidase MepM/ murein hydrolase activator NlpD
VSAKGQRVTIMVHKDGDLRSRSLRLPVWLLRVALVVGSTILALILLATAVYAPIVRTAARVPGLNRELRHLRAENEQVRRLASTLAEMESRYDQVRTMLGGDLIPERTLQHGSVPVAHSIVASPPGPSVRYAVGPSIPSYWPLDGPGLVTRGPVGGGGDGEAHRGLDVAIPMGTPIRAAGGGRVQRAGDDPEYGRFVLIAHPDGYRTMYGHASRLLVAAGDSVTAGQVIGLSGSTGRSTAPHLHYEVLRDGRSIDPRSLLNRES